jgi:hypothetical protein
MPYQIKKVEKGWKVFTKGTDDAHSNKPLSLANAKAQMKALYANADDSEKFGGFDDDDFEKLFGVFGGAEEDDDEIEKKKEDESDALLKLDKDASSFDVEEATGEPEYIKQAKKFAKKAGYKDWNSLKLADDGKHKLVLRGVKFGSINNNDYIIYKQHFPTIADVKRKQYLARATKIKGDWAKDRYSPNSLAINILWDGSSKKGGDNPFWGNDEDVYYDVNGKPISKEEYDKQFEPVKSPVEPILDLDKIPVEPEYPEQPQFVGDPTQFKPQPYDPNNPLMYMVGGRIEPKNAAKADTADMKEAKQILKRVAGDGSATIKKIEATPMGDNNIRQYLPNARVITYKELADVSSIEELLPKPKDYFFLLYEHAPNVGHFVSVNRYIDNGRDTICFFCSYGSKIDAPLFWNSPAKNQELGQNKPYLTNLLRKSGKKLQYNNVQYQSKQSPVATCGAFATLWIKANLRDNMNLQDFHEWITEIKNETGLTYDNIAANAISAR